MHPTPRLAALVTSMIMMTTLMAAATTMTSDLSRDLKGNVLTSSQSAADSLRITPGDHTDELYDM
jgi:hypothetical protein